MAGYKNPRKFVQVKIRCDCGHEQTIRRKKNKLKKRGHVKNMWCINCKKETPHIEVGPV